MRSVGRKGRPRREYWRKVLVLPLGNKRLLKTDETLCADYDLGFGTIVPAELESIGVNVWKVLSRRCYLPLRLEGQRAPPSLEQVRVLRVVELELLLHDGGKGLRT